MRKRKQFMKIKKFSCTANQEMKNSFNNILKTRKYKRKRKKYNKNFPLQKNSKNLNVPLVKKMKIMTNHKRINKINML